MKKIITDLKNELFKIQSQIETIESARDNCIKNLCDPMRIDKDSISRNAVNYMNQLAKLNENARLINGAISNLMSVK